MRFLRKRTLAAQINALLSQPQNDYPERAKAILTWCREDAFTSSDLPLLPYVEWAAEAAHTDETESVSELDAVLSRAAQWGHKDESLPPLIQRLIPQVRQRRSELLLGAKAARGFHPIRKDPDGTAVYLDVQIYRTRDEGRLLVTDRGLRYVGPVLLEIPWTNVIHLHRENAQEFGVQERRRKTLTKFGFLEGDWNEQFAILEWCWNQFKTAPTV
jgi:hypothetical protein